MSHDGGFAPIAVVVQQLLLCVDVSGGHQDQMRGSIDGVKLCLAVAGFTVVDQSSKTARFLCSVHTVGGQRIKIKLSRQASTLEVIAPKDILFSPITTANIMTPGGHFPLKRLLITTPPWLGLNLKNNIHLYFHTQNNYCQNSLTIVCWQPEETLTGSIGSWRVTWCCKGPTNTKSFCKIPLHVFSPQEKCLVVQLPVIVNWKITNWTKAKTMFGLTSRFYIGTGSSTCNSRSEDPERTGPLSV